MARTRYTGRDLARDVYGRGPSRTPTKGKSSTASKNAGESAAVRKTGR